LKLSMNSLRDNLRKAAVERLGSMVDILLLWLGICIIELYIR
jgi:hypothetical protein